MKRYAYLLTTLYVMSLFILLAACGQLDGSVLTFKSADPGVSVAFFLLPAPVEEVGEVAPDPLPAPPCIVVKGNISRDGRKLYHVEGMSNFETVKIDEAAGERFFCSTAEAEAAGWVKAGN